MILRALFVMLTLLALAACAPKEEPMTEPPVRSPAATNDPLIERELLFGNPERTQLRVSPDGRSLSYIAPVEGVLNVWVAPIDDIDAARPVTRDTGRGIFRHFWSPNSQYLLYLQDSGGDENFLLHAVTLDGGETRNLTPFENTTVNVTHISPDHPDTILVGLNNRDPRFHDIHRLTLSTGKLELIERNEGYLGYLADDDLRVRLAFAPRSGGGLDVLRKDGDGFAHLLTIEQEDDMVTQPVAISPDGQQVYMIDSRDRDTGALARIHLQTGERDIIATDERADVAGVFIDVVSGEASAYAVNYKKPEWVPLNDDFRRDFDRLQAAIEGDLQITSQSYDGRYWSVYSGQAKSPGTAYLYDRESGRIETLFETQPALADQPLTSMQPLLIEARDGLSLVSYLSLPRWVETDEQGLPEAPLPMVLLVHGGPWARDSYGFDSQHQWLANRGYAVMSVNFRGSTGFGKAFINAGDREWGRAMHHDLLDAVEWAVEQGITGRDQVAIMGGSYGGYATLVGLAFTPDVFACGVDIVGPSNLETLLASIPPYWEAFFENLATRVGDPRTEDGLALLKERSPLYRADAISKPLLIAQGANDPRVKQAESDQIVQAMLGNERPVTYVLYPDEGHGFARPQNRLAFYGIAEAFLAECLGGRRQDLAGTLDGSSTQVPTGAEFVTGLKEALEDFEPVVTH